MAPVTAALRVSPDSGDGSAEALVANNRQQMTATRRRMRFPPWAVPPEGRPYDRRSSSVATSRKRKVKKVFSGADNPARPGKSPDRPQPRRQVAAFRPWSDVFEITMHG